MLNLLTKGIQANTFLIKDFFHLPPVSTNQGLGGNWFMKKSDHENLVALSL